MSYFLYAPCATIKSGKTNQLIIMTLRCGITRDVSTVYICQSGWFFKRLVVISIDHKSKLVLVDIGMLPLVTTATLLPGWEGAATVGGEGKSQLVKFNRTTGLLDCVEDWFLGSVAFVWPLCGLFRAEFWTYLCGLNFPTFAT